MEEKVLVTGATGFTGGALTAALLEQNSYVRILVRKRSGYQHLKSNGCEICYGDLATGEGLEEAVDGVDKVYHIGAAFRVEGVPKKYFWDVNVGGTRKLLDASLKYGIKRFIHCSTVGVHGDIANPPANEETPYNPGDHYQESKLEGERLALGYVKKGLGVVIFRPFGIYGPGDKRFLKLFKPISKGKWFIVGKGNNLYHLTYIDDLIQGILLCGKVEGIEGEVFILGGEKYTNVRELGEIIAQCMGIRLKIYKLPIIPIWIAAYLCEVLCRPLKIEPPLFRRRLDFFLKDRAFEISKAQKILGFHSRVSLEKGLKLTIEWYIKNNLISL